MRHAIMVLYAVSIIAGLIGWGLLIGRLIFGNAVPFQLSFVIVPTVLLCLAKIIGANLVRWNRSNG